MGSVEKPLSLKSAALLRSIAAGILVWACAVAAAADPRCAPLFERVTQPVPDIPIYGELGPIPNPWFGGWEKPRPQLIDYDGDGDLDLFVDESDGKLRYYRNDGTPQSANFIFQTDEYTPLHELEFSRFADLNGDGIFDLLVEAPKVLVEIDGSFSERPGAYLYFNEGTAAAPNFVNHSPHPGGYWADDAGIPITFFNTIPDFVDLDKDGDLDLMMGDGGNTGFLIFYRNTGSPTAPVFHLETRQYRSITIVFGACMPQQAPRISPRHGFMLFEFQDIDDDGDEDLFVGDEFNFNIYFLKNTDSGAETSPNLDCQTDAYLPGPQGAPGVFIQYLQPTFGDLDGDGDFDALLGSKAGTFRSLISFVNNGTATIPQFQLQSEDAVPEFDLGVATAPHFQDLDGDGDPDLLLGAGGNQRVELYENGGSLTNPAFFLSNPELVTSPGAPWMAPETADIDDDGDLDLFVGTSSGAVKFWRNTSVTGWPPVYTEVTNDLAFGTGPNHVFRDNIDDYAVPRFFDEDGDGDLDALVGNWNFSGKSTLMFFRNTGTPQAHTFVLAEADYESLGPMGQNTAPVFGDLDGDGDQDLVVGNYDGELTYIRNFGTSGKGGFHVEDRHLGSIDVGGQAIPALADFDDDGDLDLICGESGGGLNYFRNASAPGRFDIIVCDVPDGIERRTVHRTGSDLDPRLNPTSSGGELQFAITNAYPSPSRGPTTVEFALPRAGHVRAEILDAAGRRVVTLMNDEKAAGAQTLVWNGRASGGEVAAPGVYRARIEFGGQVLSRSFVRLR
ncbi:MAG TPA: FG-GAP-like repeat-containing protein [bacterium]|nr:FG-GAP-like repeat-containing protein [bacterium]